MNASKVVLIVILGMTAIGCASTVPPSVFLPQEDVHVRSFYRNGVPIGVANLDSLLFMFSLDVAKVSQTEYLRLWFLCLNGSSSETFLLEPAKVLRLDMRGTEKSILDIQVESPTKILAKIENNKAAALILQAVGGALQAVSTQPTTISNRQTGETWTLNDQREKIRAEGDRTAGAIATTSQLYNIFMQSINTGILRRNSIFPGESVHGYVYFPSPTVSGMHGARQRVTLEGYDFTLHIATLNGKLAVKIIQTAGE